MMQKNPFQNPGMNKIDQSVIPGNNFVHFLETSLISMWNMY